MNQFVPAMERTQFCLWNFSSLASDAALSRQSSLPKSMMDNRYDSYSSCFVLCVIRFEPSNFFLWHSKKFCLPT